MDKKERFRRNLARGMADHDLTEQQLADELRLDRYGRKWLRRLLKEGLERPDARSRELLEKLADRLGFGSSDFIWLGYVDPELATVEVFKNLWAAAGRSLRQDIERQIARWRRVCIADLLTQTKFFRTRIVEVKSKLVLERVLSEAEEVAKQVLGDDHERISQRILGIISEKDLSPGLPSSEIWSQVRPELVRIMHERLAEYHQKFPNRKLLLAEIPE